MNVNKSPKTSDGSQFHQPPHVPSCKAHQLPKNKASRLVVSTTLVELETLEKKWFPLKSDCPQNITTTVKNTSKSVHTLQ